MFLRFVMLCAAMLAISPAHAADDMPATVLAGRNLLACFNEQWLVGDRLGWSELTYYRAIKVRCAEEAKVFSSAYSDMLGDDAPGTDVRRRERKVEEALRGALLDAALDYGRAASFRLH